MRQTGIREVEIRTKIGENHPLHSVLERLGVDPRNVEKMLEEGFHPIGNMISFKNVDGSVLGKQELGNELFIPNTIYEFNGQGFSGATGALPIGRTEVTIGGTTRDVPLLPTVQEVKHRPYFVDGDSVFPYEVSKVGDDLVVTLKEPVEYVSPAGYRQLLESSGLSENEVADALARTPKGTNPGGEVYQISAGRQVDEYYRDIVKDLPLE